MFIIDLHKNKTSSDIKGNFFSKSFSNGSLKIEKHIKDKYQFCENNKYICILDGFFFGKSISDVPFDSIQNIKSFLREVDGFFSLCLIEKETGLMDFFSDHIGSKSIYYTRNNGSILISNKGDYLCRNNFNVNKNKVIEYFSFAVDGGRETFFESIFKSEPRQHIKFLRNEEVYDEYFKFKLSEEHANNNEKDFIDAYKNIFLNTLNYCADIAPSKIGSALSGGLDSSSITAGLNKITTKKIHAQTVLFKGLEGSQNLKTNEKEYADEVTRALNIPHDCISLTNSGCISNFKSTNENFFEPNGLVNGYVHNAIFKNLQKNKITLFFDGFAGDSVIGHGYLYLNILAKQWKIFELLNEDRLIHKKRDALQYFSELRTLKRVLLPTHLHPKLMWYLDSFRKGENRFKVWGKRIKSQLREDSIYNNLKSFYGFDPTEISQNTQEAHLRSIISPHITSSIRNAQQLADQYNVKVIFPFLSKRMIQLSINTPVTLKLKKGADRYIFRRSMEGIVPKKILQRYTKSNLSPFSMNEISRLNLINLENELASRCEGLFDFNYIRNRVFKEKRRYFVEIYQLYEFNKWLQKRNLFID